MSRWNSSRVIALTGAGMVAGLSTTVQAAALMLACEGTATLETTDAKPEPISMGIVVDFTAPTVTGFTYPGSNVPVAVTGYDEVQIVFGGSSKTWSVGGVIDRVTGKAEATSTVSNPQTGSITWSTTYVLKCEPSQRMF
jgi:hypothetical protein